MKAIGILCLSVLVATASFAMGTFTVQVDQPAIDIAMRRGELMFAYDQAAWHGSDAAQADGRFKELAPLIGGWIVEGPADTPTLFFVSRDEQSRVLMSIKTTGGGTRVVSIDVSTDTNAQKLDALGTRMVNALRVARLEMIKENARFCADKPPNSVVLPPDGPNQSIMVYFLTPQTDLSKVPAGGHHRVEVGVDGKIISTREFTKTCIDVDTRSAPKKPIGFGLTHLLDDIPTEIHAFVMLGARKPLFVATGPNDRIWAIERIAGHPQSRLLSASMPK